MSDDSKSNGMENTDFTDVTAKTVTDYTQVASCAVGIMPERRRQSLRAKLEREQFERENEADENFITTFRNLFKTTG